MFMYEKQVKGSRGKKESPRKDKKQPAAPQAIRLRSWERGGNPVFNHGVMQRVWIGAGPSQDFAWHALRDGVRWYCSVADGKLYYRIEKQMRDPALREFYEENAGKSMEWEEWVELMAEAFRVDAGLLEDRDDPVYEEPRFLMNGEDRRKIELARELTLILRRRGFHPFLGGAAAATLFTATRPINDLDFRLDGLERNLFHKSSKDRGRAGELLQLLSEMADGGIVQRAERGYTTVKCTIRGIDVSITSEPSVLEEGDKPLTLSRGEMVSGIESNGEFTFLFDKACAVAGRSVGTAPKSIVTDLYDIIKVLQYNGSASYIFRMLGSIKGEKILKMFRDRLQAVKSRSPQSAFRRYIDEVVGTDAAERKSFFDQLDTLYKLTSEENQVAVRIL